MLEYIIERMQEKDLDQVLEIERLSFPTPWSRHSFISELRDNEFAHYFVCRVDGRVAGYAGMWVILDEAHITNVAVHPDYRGKGLGHLLLAELMRQSLLRGADRITLEVRKSNLAAQRIYEHMGFRATGIRKGYYTDTGEDAVIMWKILYSNGQDPATSYNF